MPRDAEGRLQLAHTATFNAGYRPGWSVP